MTTLTTVAATGALKLSWLLLAFPLFGAVVLLLGGRRTDKWGHLLGCVMPVAAFVYGLIAFFSLLGDTQRSQDQHLFSYIPVAGLQVNEGLLVDQLSISFVLLITGVGSLIHIYSVGYMAHDSDRRRFFGYLNLFIAAMLLLVLSDNYLGLYVGWEGVGLASYLLIGFWQFKPAAAVAAKKAFIANRVGDAGLSLAIMLMFAEFGTVWLPYLIRKLDHAVMLGRRPTWGKLPGRPSQVFKEHCLVAPYPEENVSRAAEVVGWDCLVFGSDFPHSEGLPDPVQYVRTIEHIGSETVRKLMRTNLEQLLTFG